MPSRECSLDATIALASVPAVMKIRLCCQDQDQGSGSHNQDQDLHNFQDQDQGKTFFLFQDQDLDFSPIFVSKSQITHSVST